jgi:hypothetical protein
MEEDALCRIWGQKDKGHYAFHLETLYHTYGLLVEGRCSLLNLGSKGQIHWTLKWEYGIWFQGFRVTPYHTWTTHGM